MADEKADSTKSQAQRVFREWCSKNHAAVEVLAAADLVQRIQGAIAAAVAAERERLALVIDCQICDVAEDQDLFMAHRDFFARAILDQP